MSFVMNSFRMMGMALYAILTPPELVYATLPVGL
jgi:hypothetical protein